MGRTTKRQLSSPLNHVPLLQTGTLKHSLPGTCLTTTTTNTTPNPPCANLTMWSPLWTTSPQHAVVITRLLFRAHMVETTIWLRNDIEPDPPSYCARAMLLSMQYNQLFLMFLVVLVKLGTVLVGLNWMALNKSWKRATICLTFSLMGAPNVITVSIPPTIPNHRYDHLVWFPKTIWSQNASRTVLGIRIRGCAIHNVHVFSLNSYPLRKIKSPQISESSMCEMCRNPFYLQNMNPNANAQSKTINKMLRGHALNKCHILPKLHDGIPNNIFLCRVVRGPTSICIVNKYTPVNFNLHTNHTWSDNENLMSKY